MQTCVLKLCKDKENFQDMENFHNLEGLVLNNVELPV